MTNAEIASAQMLRFSALQVVRGLILPRPLADGITRAIAAIQMPLFQYAGKSGAEVKKAFISKCAAALGGIDDAVKAKILKRLEKKL